MKGGAVKKPKRSNRTLWGIKRPDGSVVQDVRAARTKKDAARDWSIFMEARFRPPWRIW